MSKLIKSVSIENIVNQRAAVIEHLEQAFDAIDRASAIAAKANMAMPRLIFDQRVRILGSDAVNLSNASQAQKAWAMTKITHIVDSSGWKHLMSESGMRSFMDAETRREWEEALADGDGDGDGVPALTKDAIVATFGQMYDGRGAMVEQGIINCFKNLSWDHKTNQPFKFGNKIIIRSVLSDNGTANHGRSNILDDLLRLFHIADDKPQADHRDGMYAAFQKAVWERKTEIENDYLHMRWFKNGNGHITFKQPHLVQKLNDILIKHYPNALDWGRGR
ncbi:DUF4942 domain-containing protein [Kushneria indalinina]|uniref:Uncharacterized protein DUF4942 n=1 Tax=Kushneria indalinina DSM 14324 TaxID=1122140 RepID=A0A3D9DSC0_9GAMM|nr:DUF4942 domain-containing protein [Kushneria indalinina]REC93299.1 uncharacterized protein DUF4942 [Kushneria indalinina DSM 14324]